LSLVYPLFSWDLCNVEKSAQIVNLAYIEESNHSLVNTLINGK